MKALSLEIFNTIILSKSVYFLFIGRKPTLDLQITAYGLLMRNVDELCLA